MKQFLFDENPKADHRRPKPSILLCLFVAMLLCPSGTAAAPFAFTQPAKGVTTTRATLTGMGTPNGSASMAWFEWGATKSYGSTTAPIAVGAGSSVVRVTTDVNGLTTSQVYHYRLVVSNVTGVVRGADQAFITGGIMIAWGYDFMNGELRVPRGLSNTVSIASGETHHLALRTDGTVVAWGNNLDEQTNVPPNLNSVVAIGCGQGQSFAVRSDGTVEAWGYDGLGQTDVPPDLNNVIAVAGGNNHTLVLRSDGTVRAWGFNDAGQTDIPTGLNNVVAIAAGGFHNIALRNDGSLAMWGSDYFGQATAPPEATNIVAIAAGDSHSLALRRDGTVVAWGNDEYDQVPAPPGLSNVVAIAAGELHNLTLFADSTIEAWGYAEGYPAEGQSILQDAVAVSAGRGSCLSLGRASYDFFASRLRLTGTSTNFQTSTAGSTAEANEPSHSGLSPSNSLWFTWTAPLSGGVVFKTETQPFFCQPRPPVLAVYTGTALSTLVKVAYNAPPAATLMEGTAGARVAFNAVSGETYHIALDCIGVCRRGVRVTVKLRLTSPPANDRFSNASSIVGDVYADNGSFLGATLETNEPTHGTPNYPQTLWWSWTAPNDLVGVTMLPVRIGANAVSFPPSIGVYLGSTVASVQPVQLRRETNGMTTSVTFDASLGATYHIALAGTAHDTQAVIPLVGNFQFQFNTRPLAISITNLMAMTGNGSGSVPFTANALIQNFGAARSNPLRVYVTAVPGASERGVVAISFPTNEILQGTWPASPVVLSPGQSQLVPIMGSAPAPMSVDPTSAALGYGVYARLQTEDPISGWTTVDQVLVLFGNWPNFDGVIGPSGGVIRIDPSLAGAGQTTLTNISINGPGTVWEGSVTAYQGSARYANGFTTNFTETVWTTTLFEITNGMFRAGAVTMNTPVTLGMYYTNRAQLHLYTTNIIVLDLPAPELGIVPPIGGGAFSLQVAGVPHRRHVIEQAALLSAPIPWVPLSTNTLDSQGVWIFTDPINSNSQRYYRARELP